MKFLHAHVSYSWMTSHYSFLVLTSNIEYNSKDISDTRFEFTEPSVSQEITIPTTKCTQESGLSLINFEKELDIRLYPNDNVKCLTSIKIGSNKTI